MTLRAERIKEIIDIVRRDKAASVSKLAEIFGVHPTTIRRDLAEIEERGLLQRTYGGIIEEDITNEPPFSERVSGQYEEKERIGKAAAGLVKDGEHIILDSGTTTLHIARHLHNRKGLTVITNDVNIASELRDAPGVEVIVTGGSLRRGTYMLNGMFTQGILQNIHVQKAFIGIPAVHPVHGITHPEIEFVLTKQLMIKAARHIIVTADHTKISKLSLHSVAPVHAIHTLVTDGEAPESQMQLFQAAGVEVIKA